MTRKILVVDDNSINRQVLKHVLQSEYDTVEAVNGEEALAVIEKDHKALSAVLLDIVMPVLDGYEVLARMRTNPLLERLPVIVVTGSEDESSRIHALSLGANDFITKPYSPEIVKHCLRNNIALHETSVRINAIQKDRLTSLYNREFFFEKADELIKSHEPGFYTIACFDIDNFKLVNDQYGAAEGNRILQHVGAAIRDSFKHVDGLCGRISGDNFAGLFPNDPDSVEYITSGHSSGRYLPHDSLSNLAVSVGRYVVNDTSLPASALYDRAYIAKRSIKGRYDKHIAYFDDSMLEALVREQRIVDEMDAALAAGQFEIWFQPQYNHSSGALTGSEALVRWRHPERGLVPPGDFIPIFESNGFIYELDRFVWEEACRTLRKWLDEGREPLPVSVNISRQDVFHADILDMLSALLEKYHLPAELLRLEITESAFAQSASQIIAVVKRMVEAGFTVEIDDFGSGYSSLNTLKDVPAQVLKLDMRFLEGSENAQRGGNIVESSVRMAMWLGMTVIAEGVETAEQADYLTSIGCFLVQGYLYERPMPREGFEAIMASGKRERTPVALETVAGLDNDSFWSPGSLDTLIFNSYIGGAGIWEYHNGHFVLIRANEKLARVIGDDDFTIADAFAINWRDHVDDENLAIITDALRRSIASDDDVTFEAAYIDFPRAGSTTYLRNTFRTIARTNDRYLIYCTTENITAEKLAKQKLSEANSHLKLLTDSIQGGLATFELSPRGSHLVYFNEGFYRSLGYTRDEYADLTKDDPFHLVFPEDRENALAAVRRLLAGTAEVSSGAYRSYTKDGGYRWFSMTGTIMQRHGDTLTISAVRYDITEQKEAEQRLRSANSQLKLLTDSIPGGIATYDCAAGDLSPEHAKIVYFNDGFCKLFGFTREEYQARSAADPTSMLFDEDRHILNDQFAAQISTGTPIDCVYRVHVKGGGYKWINHKAEIVSRHENVIRINGMLMDVTERYETNERIRLREEEYRLAAEHSGNTIAHFDPIERTMTISRKAAEKLGIPELISNVPYQQVREGSLSPESEKAYIDFYEEIVHGGASGKGLYQFKEPDGWHWLEAHYSTVFARDGKPAFAVVSLFDVTEQLEKEALYNRWQQSLNDKNPDTYVLFRCNLSGDCNIHITNGAMLQAALPSGLVNLNERSAEYVNNYVFEEDREKYLSTVNSDKLLAGYYRGERSHSIDFRETRIDGSTRWLRLNIDLMEYPSSTDVEAYLMFEDIDAAKRAELRTREMVDTDPLTGALNRTAFIANIAEIAHTSPPYQQHALMMLDIDGFKLVNDSLGHGVGDQALIDIVNSLRGILRKDDLLARLGGDEFLMLLRDIPDDKVALDKAKQVCALVRKTFTLDVQISGSVGIAVWPRDGLNFEALYTKADVAMYHVKNNGHDGFAFYHDNMEGESLLPDDGASVYGSLGEKKRRMLIVDDNRIDCVMMSNIFAEEFRVEKATDGPAALIRMRHYGSAISVVLLDLMMPGMDGFTVLEKMRSSAELRLIPVIVVSAAGDHATCLRALKCGAVDFVTKPIDPDMLRIRVEAAISKAENERLRAHNSLQKLQSGEVARYKAALEHSGIMVIEHDWVNGSFTYDPTLGEHVAGVYDERPLWRIFLSDMVADTPTVKRMQEMVHAIAGDRSRTEDSIMVRLKTPSKEPHWFNLSIYKQTDEFGLTNKLMLTLRDVGSELPQE